MNLQHVNVKIFLDAGTSPDLERMITVFHRWVAESVTAEMLIDVADYRHVPNGPGVVLVGLEADYSMDHAAGQWGLRFNCKGARDGSNADRFAYSLQAAAKACLQLQSEFDSLQFDCNRIQFFINDRALAPNNEETHNACQSELTQIFSERLGDAQLEFDYNREPRSLFGAIVTLSSPFGLARLAADPVRK